MIANAGLVDTATGTAIGEAWARDAGFYFVILSQRGELIRLDVKAEEEWLCAKRQEQEELKPRADPM